MKQSLCRAGHARPATKRRPPPARARQRDLAVGAQAALELGHATGRWFIDATHQDLRAALVIEHERQLRVTPLGALDRALDRARHFIARLRRNLRSCRLRPGVFRSVLLLPVGNVTLP